MTMGDDRSHFVLCDWNLYQEDRHENWDLCNLDCLRQPEQVATNWRSHDADYPNIRRQQDGFGDHSDAETTNND
jgi:hypothetical protein